MMEALFATSVHPKNQRINSAEKDLNVLFVFICGNNSSLIIFKVKDNF